MKKSFLSIMLILVLGIPLMGAVTVDVAGQDYTLPSEPGEEGWADQVTNWMQAISQYTLQTAGGPFTLTEDLNLGATYGVQTNYVEPNDGTPPDTGFIRIPQEDSIVWRNEADDGNIVLSKDVSDRLQIDGDYILTGENSVTISNKVIDSSNTLTSPTLSGATLNNVTINSIIDGTAVNSAGALSTSTTSIATQGVIKSYVDQFSTAILAGGGTMTGNLIMDNRQAIRFEETTANGDHYVGITPPAALAASYTLVLPDTQPATDDCLRSISGVTLDWAPCVDTTDGYVLDEDDMASNSATSLATQQSIKAYVDNSIAAAGTGLAVTAKTANYTATGSDDYIECDATLGDVTITLPATPSTGDLIIVKKIDNAINNECIVDDNGGPIDGSFGTEVMRLRYHAMAFVYDGANWMRIYQYLPQIAWDVKELTADISSDQQMTDLDFSNIGTFLTYRISGQVVFVQDTAGGSDDDCSVIFYESSNAVIGAVRIRKNEATDTNEDTFVIPFSFLFQTGGTTTGIKALSSGTSVNCIISGNNTRAETFVTIEELGQTHKQNSKF